MTFMTALRRAAVAAAIAATTLSPAFADKAAEDFVAGILVDANAVFKAPDIAARNAGIEVSKDAIDKAKPNMPGR